MDYYTLESANIIIIREATYLRVEIFNITKCRLITQYKINRVILGKLNMIPFIK